MSGPYFPYFMKQAMREAQEDIQHLLSSLRGTALHKGAVSLDDVCAIIKALEFHDPEIRDLAQATLAKIAGSDYGPTPDAWEKWWKIRGESLRERHRLEDAAEGAFRSLRALIMKADWEQAVELLHKDALDGDTRADVVSWLTEHKKDIRRAYRDASGTLTSIAKDKACIEIVWGEYGYRIREAHLVLEGGQWLFASVPWESASVITKADDSNIDTLAHDMAEGHAKSRHLRIEEGRRLLEQEQDEPLAMKTTPAAKWISICSGILVGIGVTIYLAQGRDPRIAGSCSFLGLFIGAIYSITAAYVSLARSPENRLLVSLAFLAGSVLIVSLLHG